MDYTRRYSSEPPFGDLKALRDTRRHSPQEFRGKIIQRYNRLANAPIYLAPW
jgi:hypothetical protein